MRMKQIKYVSGILFAFLLIGAPMAADAATVRTGRDYALQKSETIDGNLYLASQNSIISGAIKGEAAVVSGNALLTGAVSGDVLAAGGTVDILGDVGQNVRVVGGTVLIGKTVKGDVAVAGGVVRIAPDAVIEGDLIAAAGTLIIDGTVKGRIQARGGSVLIHGTIGKDVSLQATREVTIGKGGNVEGNLVYESVKEATIEQGATVHGSTTYTRRAVPGNFGEQMNAALFGLIALFALIKLLVMLTSAVVGVLLFKKASVALTKSVVDNIGKELVRGFVVLILVPLAAIALLVTVIGSAFGIALGLIYGVLLIVARIATGIVAGAIVVKVLKKTKEYEVTWQNAVIGVFALYIIAIVPILGWVADFVLFLAILGAAWMMAYQKIWAKR